MAEYTYVHLTISTNGVDQEKHEQAREIVRVCDSYIHRLTRLLRIAARAAEKLDRFEPEIQRDLLEFFAEDVIGLTELIESFQLAMVDEINYLSGIEWEFDGES